MFITSTNQSSIVPRNIRPSWTKSKIGNPRAMIRNLHRFFPNPQFEIRNSQFAGRRERLGDVRTALLGAVLLLAGLGCAARPPFAPVTGAPDDAAAGYDARTHDLEVDERELGQATVWSAGIEDLEGEPSIRVGILIENDASDPMELRLNRTELQVEAYGYGRITVEDERVDLEETVIPVDQERRFTLIFALPKGLKPRRVDVYRFRWLVAAGDERIRHTTVFAREGYRRPPGRYQPLPPTYFHPYYRPYSRSYPHGYYDPFYDPFRYDPFYHRYWPY